MLSPKASFATTAKAVFYKFCFCLGLGTASYYSYAQVNHWATDDAPKGAVTQSISSFQQKVQNLTQSETVTSEQHAAEMKRIVRAGSFIQNPTASIDVNTVKALPVVAPVDAPIVEAVNATETTAAVSPSPSPADGEVKEEKTAEATAENPDAVQGPIPYAQPLMANGMPVPYAMLAQSYVQNQNQPQPEAHAVVAPSAENNSNLPAQFAAGSAAMPAGFNSGFGSAAPTPAPSSANSSAAIYTTPIYSGSYSDTSILSTQDLVTLTSPMQAKFADQQLSVNGMVCAETVRASCVHQNDVSVHSLRWGTEEGLESAVTFAVKAASGSIPVQFDVKFKIQDYALNEQSVSIVTKPSEILVHTESRDSKVYKIYEFKLPDTTVRSDDALTQIQAVIVYEVTPQGMVMTQDSKFSFARATVKTLNSNWSPSEPNRAPAQNEIYFVADELPYSINLQKSL